jgi:L-threonylcarbamoyladenylate synthase
VYRDISKRQLETVLTLLHEGKLVALPTETVYGLAADASNEHAVAKIFQAKGRPSNHPLIVHIGSVNQLSQWAKDMPDYAHKLAKAFWPGPMTLILKKQMQVLDAVTGGQDSVGIRISSHPIMQKVLQHFNGGLAAPSANRFGHISPSLAKHVKQSLGDKVDLIIDGGATSVGIESTIIDCTQNHPRILRPGMITADEIAQITHLTIAKNSDETPRVSGDLKSHYAPVTKTFLVGPKELTKHIENNPSMVIISRSKPNINKVIVHDARLPTQQAQHDGKQQHWIIMPNDAQAYAHCLYEQLHFADQLNCGVILIEKTPNTQEWLGVCDRLQKASCQL